VGIVHCFAHGVVFAMDRRPLFGDHPGRQPQPKAEEMARNRVQIQCPMSLVAVQKDGHGSYRDVREH
jgi:hypothetical protein